VVPIAILGGADTDCYLGGSRESECDERRLYNELFVSAARMRVVPV
jgi:hypothetical protein